MARAGRGARAVAAVVFAGVASFVLLYGGAMIFGAVFQPYETSPAFLAALGSAYLLIAGALLTVAGVLVLDPPSRPAWIAAATIAGLTVLFFGWMAGVTVVEGGAGAPLLTSAIWIIALVALTTCIGAAGRAWRREGGRA
ncbi:MAG: hypothetical protein IVW36_04565 [Dehalococcoidia bacterium]|nr:hypothetical protein [Dehalococcoidia bacterium]